MKKILKKIADSFVGTFHYLTLTPSKEGRKWCWFIGEQGRRVWKEVEEFPKKERTLHISHTIDRDGNKIVHRGHYGC